MDEMGGGLDVACGGGRTLGKRSGVQVGSLQPARRWCSRRSVLGLHASEPESTFHQLGGDSSMSWAVPAIG